MAAISSAPTSRGLRTTQLVWDDCLFQIVTTAIFLIFVGAHMNIVFIVKVKIHDDIKWSYRFPQVCWFLSPYGNMFWARSPISSEYMSFECVLRSTPNHTTLKCRCLIRKSNHKGMLILLCSCYSYLNKTGHIFKFWTSWLPPFNRRICWHTSICLISWEICESSMIIWILWYWNMMNQINRYYFWMLTLYNQFRILKI